MADDAGLLEFLEQETTLGRIQSRCEEYLNGRIFRRQIHLDTGDYTDELSIYATVGALSIQQIINDHETLDTIHLRRPAPELLPIVISKISEDTDSFIIPSEELDIRPILSHAPRYELDAIICEINDRTVIFMRRPSTDDWYYYQEKHACERFSENLNSNLNRIIRARTREQKRLIESAHFLVSMIFYNAVKYIYKQET